MRLIALSTEDLEPYQFSRIFTPSSARYALEAKYLFGSSSLPSICRRYPVTRCEIFGVGVSQYREDRQVKQQVLSELNSGQLLASTMTVLAGHRCGTCSLSIKTAGWCSIPLSCRRSIQHSGSSGAMRRWLPAMAPARHQRCCPQLSAAAERGGYDHHYSQVITMRTRWLSIAIMMFGIIWLAGCNGMKKIEPEDYFTGQQLVLAKAIEAGDLNRVKQLAPETDLNTPGEQKLTPLFFAINEAMYNDNPANRLEIITALVSAGADPLPQERDKPALWMAKADKDIWLKAMLDGGLSPDARDKDNDDPIIYETINAKTTDTLALLIMRGVDVDARDSLGETPLMAAFFSNSFEHANYLLDHGADPNPVNNKGGAFASLVQRRLNKSRSETEYHQNCLRLRDKMIARGVKWPPEA